MANEPSLVPMDANLIEELKDGWTQPVRIKVTHKEGSELTLVAYRARSYCPLCGALCDWDHCKLLCPHHGILATCADPGF